VGCRSTGVDNLQVANHETGAECDALRLGTEPVVHCLSRPRVGVPQHDERKLFEFLLLEGAQAGLSRDTILRKRENYRTAFDNFEMETVARYTEKKIQSLLRDDGIVRNRLKVVSAVDNA
jgi:DNA-3-methyladenine glycosylase I